MYYHYKIWINDKLVIDGHGVKDRVEHLLAAFKGEVKGKKHTSTLTALAAYHLGHNIKSVVTEYKTKEEAKAAELASHKWNGTPKWDQKDQYVDQWISGLKLTPVLAAILDTLRVNQDTVYTTALNKLYKKYPELKGIINGTS